MSSEAAARVCDGLKVRVSPESVLHSTRKTNILRDEDISVLGIDDWAIKKGQNYGTILVDLEKHQTIDLPPDRTQTTLSEWLQNHPEIEIIVRDRSFEYKAGIEKGTPQALQVVDRWHLLQLAGKNARDHSWFTQKGKNGSKEERNAFIFAEEEVF